MYPDDLKYSDEHEWARASSDDPDIVEVGVTHYAQDSLGDVVYLELPQVGDTVTQFGKFGEIESVKAVSDLFSPLSGTIVEVNDALIDSPEKVNDEPYGGGWIMKIRISDSAELDQLMDAAAYSASLG